MVIQAHFKPTRVSPTRRSGARRKLRLETTGKPGDKGSASVEILDLSTSGMLLETSMNLQVGETLEVELPRTGPKAASVIWTSGRFFGCRFAEAISPAALSAALLQSQPASPRTRESPKRSVASGENFGSKLTKLRNERNLSLQDLADELGVSRQAVWYWESGQRLPRGEMFQQLAKTLCIPENELLAPVGSLDEFAECDWHDEIKRLVAERLGVGVEQVSISINL